MKDEAQILQDLKKAMGVLRKLEVYSGVKTYDMMRQKFTVFIVEYILDRSLNLIVPCSTDIIVALIQLKDMSRLLLAYIKAQHELCKTFNKVGCKFSNEDFSIALRVLDGNFLMYKRLARRG